MMTFDSILERMAANYEGKKASYKLDPIISGLPAHVALLFGMTDKVTQANKLTQGQPLTRWRGKVLQATFLDLAIYAVLAILTLEGRGNKKGP